MSASPEKKAKTDASLLEQLKGMTQVVADTGARLRRGGGAT